jgi:hypothetical protein
MRIAIRTTLSRPSSAAIGLKPAVASGHDRLAHIEARLRQQYPVGHLDPAGRSTHLPEAGQQAVPGHASGVHSRPVSIRRDATNGQQT